MNLTFVFAPSRVGAANFFLKWRLKPFLFTQNFAMSPRIRSKLVVALAILLCACARGPIKDPSQSLRLTSSPEMFDDLPLKSLVEALQVSVDQLTKDPEKVMAFGEFNISQGEYAQSLLSLRDFIIHSQSKSEIYNYIKERFQFLEIYGREKWGEVFMTSYYVPVIKGSLRKTKTYSQALYKTPKDLVSIDFGAYAKKFSKWQKFTDTVFEQKSKRAIVRGRLVDKDPLSEVIPFYDRSEIDEKKSLKGQKLEIVYVDPIDSFFLQIQGSGVVELSDGRRLHLGYASQNGHPYVSIGKYLLDVIPLEEMSLQKIEDHLRTLSAQDLQDILNRNPSYVFFQKEQGKAQTFFGTSVVDGRTIATDYTYFPKGALAFLEFSKPEFENEKAIEPSGWIPTSRFVVDHDTGGAIRGPDRLDLFWGLGPVAKQHAGVIRHTGRLTYLLPKLSEQHALRVKE